MLVRGNVVEGRQGRLCGRPRWPATGQRANCCGPSLQADIPRSAFWSHFVVGSVGAGGVAAGLSRCSQRRHHQQARAKHLACVARFADQANAVKGFIDWMDASGIVTSKKIEILPDQEGGRCVKSTAAIQKGEVLVQLPEASAASVDMSEKSPAPSVLAPLAEWWSGNPRSSIRLAAVLVFQREKFGPYIDMLYPMENIYAPWLWEDEDLKFLPDKLAAKAAARRRALDSACTDLKATGLAEAVPEELFLRAHHAAASRAFAGEGQVSSARTAALACGALALTAAGAAAATGVTSLDAAAGVGAVGVAASGAVVALNEDSKVLSLLPMIDQINHRSGAPPDLQFDPASRRWELRALRAYSAGEEICFSYGDKDSDALLLQHGFVEEDNGADKLTLSLPAAGSYGLSAEAKSELDALGVQELVFARDGSLQGLTEVSRQNLLEVVATTLRSAVPSCSASDDAEVARSVSSPGIGRVLLRWRAERRKLLEAAAERWKVEDVKQ